MLKLYFGITLFLIQTLTLQAQMYKFTWEGAVSGNKAVWGADDTQNTYSISANNLNVKVSILDPFGQNTTTTHMSEYGDYTKTNTFYGSGNLAFQITSTTFGQAVCLKFEFDKAIFLRDFKIYDIDMKQDGGIALNTFQDSVSLIAKREGVNTPLIITPMSSSPIYTINGQQIKANYLAGINGDVDYNDLRGAISVSSPTPITEFAIYYSNGSQDEGLSNSHAIKISEFDYEVFQSPLPVKISDLQLHKDNLQYTLQWTAESEHNNDYYTISTSVDGVKFLKIGEEKGMNLSQQKYTYDIGTITSPQLYVKLAQTDYDGNSQELGIVSAQQKISGKLTSLMSNIVSDALQIETSGDLPSAVRWEIFDLNGRFVSLGSISSGANNLDVTSLNSGTYTIKISTAYSSESHKFFKL